LWQVFNAHDADAGIPVHWITLSRVDVRDDAYIDRLSILYSLLNPVLVVFDALVDITPGADENKVVDMRPAMEGLRRLADRHATCNLVIHHSNKVGGYRGSSVIRDLVDTMVTLDGEAGSSLLKFTIDKSRDGVSKQAFCAALDIATTGDHAKLSAVGITTQQEPPKDTRPPADRYILAYMAGHTHVTTRELQEHREDKLTQYSVEHGIDRLRKEYLIRRSDNGGRGVEATYDLVLQGMVRSVGDDELF
jgi:hypothetical protein